QYELGSLFATEDPETGEYKYTGLGEAIMGKRTPIMEKGPDGSMVDSGKFTYEGGLLQQIQELGAGQKENIVTLLTTFFDAIGTFVEHIQWFSDWLDAHPQVKEVFANLLKLAAVALPFILAMGLLTKTFAKLNKIFSAALGPVARGIQGTSRVVRQTGSGIREGLRGDGFGDARDRQSRAYRNRRTQLRGGDVRGPIARLRDGITGRDSGADRLRQQMRQTEDSIRETEDAIRSLQREIRDTNAVSIRQLVDRFAGSSGGGAGGSLQGAARNANQAITNTTSETRQLNQQSLNSVRREYSDLENKVKDLVQKIKDSV